MEANLPVVEWSPDGARAYNPATRETSSGPTVADAMRKAGIAGAVGLCLSRRVSFVRETHAPDIDRAQMRMVMALQLDSLFPAMDTELAYDYEKGTHRYEDGIQAMVAAAPAESVRRAFKDVEAAGAKVAWVAPAGYGSKHVAKLEGHDDAVVVELADGFLNLDIVRHGLVVFSRSAADPGSSEGRQSEVLRTLAGYGLTSAAVLAVGETQIGSDVHKVASGSLQAMAFHNALALNIELPEVIALSAKRAGQRKGRIALFCWLGVLVVGAFVWLDRDAAAQNVARAQGAAGKERATLQKELDTVTQNLETATSELKNLNLAFAPAQPVSDVLTLVVNEVSDSAWLTGITFERGKPLLIRGTAKDGEAVTAYTSALALNQRLRDVQLMFANNAEIEGIPVVQFSISARVVGNLPLEESTSKKRSSR